MKKKEPLEVINFKVTPSDRKILEKKARLAFKGNLSAFLRAAGLTFKPVKKKSTAQKDYNR